MQWRTQSEICGVNIQVVLQEVAHANWSISLCSHMQHVDTLLILSMNICSMFDKQFYHLHIAVERGKMESCEAVVPQTYRVDPSFEFRFPLFLLGS